LQGVWGVRLGARHFRLCCADWFFWADVVPEHGLKATSPSLNMSFVAGFVKGNSGNHYNGCFTVVFW